MNQTDQMSQTEEVIEAHLRYQWPNKPFDGQKPLRSTHEGKPMLIGPRMKGSIPAIARKLFSTGKPVPFNEAGFAIMKATDEEIEDRDKYPRNITYNFGPFRTGYSGMRLFRERYRKNQANASV